MLQSRYGGDGKGRRECDLETTHQRDSGVAVDSPFLRYCTPQTVGSRGKYAVTDARWRASDLTWRLDASSFEGYE